MTIVMRAVCGGSNLVAVQAVRSKETVVPSEISTGNQTPPEHHLEDNGYTIFMKMFYWY